MNPGITVRPCRSITRVRGPACFRTSALLPTAVILPSRMAMASRVENCVSTVKIWPFTRIVSAFWDHPGEAIANANIASDAVRMKFEIWILILPTFKACLIEALRCAVLLVPVDSLAGRVHRHGAHLGEVIERLDACFTPHAAFLEASPRRRGVEPVMVIHPNHAEEQPARHSVSACNISGPYGRGQAEPRVVGDTDRVGFFFEWHDHGHRPENFFLRDLGARVGIIEHRRLDEKSRRQTGGRRLATRQQLRSCGCGAL